MNDNKQTANNGAFTTLIMVFFFWGFLAASNGIFIPFCKEHFMLNQLQSQLIDLSFYAAYFIGSLILWLGSQASNVDILNKIGYKRGIIYGLGISILGAVLMIPSVSSESYEAILASLFVIALGFSLQQASAQPFVIALGTPETGAHRLNLAGGVNSFGTLIGPLIVGYILFGGIGDSGAVVSVQSIKTLYWLLIGVFLLAAVLLNFAKLPNVNSEEKFEQGFGAFKYPQLKWGMLAIFVYVGVEVTIQSNFGALLQLPEFGAYKVSEIDQFISLYWGSLMIGRWTGALGAFNLKKVMSLVLTIVVPFAAYGLILLVNVIRGNDISNLWPYALCVLVLVAGFLVAQEKPAKMLLVFSVLGMAAMLIGLFTTGKIAVFAFVSGGLFCSIGWPCIFSMSVTGLGKYTSQGSTFLIMMILGGAVIPPIQGLIADSIGIHMSYWVAVACFAYLAWFSIKMKSVLGKQGFDIDNAEMAAH